MNNDDPGFDDWPPHESDEPQTLRQLHTLLVDMGLTSDDRDGVIRFVRQQHPDLAIPDLCAKVIKAVKDDPLRFNSSKRERISTWASFL